MSELSILIPATPSRDLSPNASRQLHWSYKYRARQELHCSAFYATKDAITRYESTHGEFVPLSGPVDVITTIAWGHGRKKMDGDNALASCKALFDGVAQAGIVENDRQFRFHPVVQIRDKDKIGYVLVTIVLTTWEPPCKNCGNLWNRATWDKRTTCPPCRTGR